MKYHIEKNTVQETLIIPLYGRKKCTEKFPQLFKDETAVRLIKQIDYDFSEVEKKGDSTMQEFGFLEIAIRQNDLAYEVKKYLKSHPNAAVVNLGCGLDNTGRNCDNDSCRIYNIDFPDVIEVRNALLPAGERENHDQTVFDINIFVLCISIGRYCAGEDIRRQGDTHSHIGIHAEKSDQHGTDDGSGTHTGKSGSEPGSHAGKKADKNGKNQSHKCESSF